MKSEREKLQETQKHLEVFEKLRERIEEGLERVASGKEESTVLFEGDFIISTGELGLEKGVTTDYPFFFGKFMHTISQKGEVVSTGFDNFEDYLYANTDAARYFRANFPNVQFPVDRISFEFLTKDGDGLYIFIEKFFWADGGKDAKKTPLMVFMTAEQNSGISKLSGLDKTKDKVPSLA